MRTPTWIWLCALLGVCAIAFGIGCKKSKHTDYGEAGPDGKAIVKGCVWFDGGGDGGDTIAFCDDGRICLDEGGWHCIQFVQPVTVERCPENGSGPAPFDAEPGAPPTRGR